MKPPGIDKITTNRNTMNTINLNIVIGMRWASNVARMEEDRSAFKI